MCLRKLDAHFHRQRERPLANSLFVYVNKLVIVCASLEEHLRDQLIEKLPDVELMKKLLEVHNTTLEAAMDKVRKWEASREQSRHATGRQTAASRQRETGQSS